MNEQKKITTELSYGSRVNAAKINTRNEIKKSAANNNREFEPDVYYEHFIGF